MKRVFVVGCPRSGTTWTTLLLEQHPVIVSMHHSKFFIYLNSLERWWRAKERPNPQPAVSKKKMYGLIGELAASVMDGMAKHKKGAQIVAEKTPENIRFWRFIHKSLPDAYFLHVVRDPRSVFSSQRSGGKSWAKGEFPTKPYDGARLWCDDVRKGRKIATATDRYHEVRYESLHDNGPEVLEKIFAWLGLQTDMAFCEKAIEACSIDKIQKELTDEKYQGFYRKGVKASWQNELSDLDVRIIEYVAGDMMQQLGYARAKTPLAKIPFRITVVERLNRLLAGTDRLLGKWSRTAWRKIRGREPTNPEVVIYP